MVQSRDGLSNAAAVAASEDPYSDAVPLPFIGRHAAPFIPQPAKQPDENVLH
jgi:hypothetical protein